MQSCSRCWSCYGKPSCSHQSPRRDELVLWEELAVPLEAEAEPAGEAVLSLLEEL